LKRIGDVSNFDVVIELQFVFGTASFVRIVQCWCKINGFKLSSEDVNASTDSGGTTKSLSDLAEAAVVANEEG